MNDLGASTPAERGGNQYGEKRHVTHEHMDVGELICQLVAMGNMDAQVFLVGDGLCVGIQDDFGQAVYLQGDDGINDSSRLEWLLHRMKGSWARELGIEWSDGSDQRAAIDRVMNGAVGGTD